LPPAFLAILFPPLTVLVEELLELDELDELEDLMATAELADQLVH